jgi:hypothetical protein
MESPVKPTINGKSYKHLFEETQPSGTRTNGNAKDDGTRPTSNLTRKFERVRSNKRTTSVDSLNWLNSRRLRDSITTDETKPGQSSSTIIDERGVTTTTEQREREGGVSNPIQMRKRSSSGASLDDQSGHAEVFSELLPPSPPQSKASLPRVLSAAQQRNKKAKIQMVQQTEGELLSDTDSNDPIQVIEEYPHARRPRHQNDETFAGDDAIYLEDMIISSPSKSHPAYATSMNTVDNDGISEDEILEVDLPDDLQRVLSIHSSRGHDHKERDLVQAVLLGGTPVTGIGGEVWGAGEFEEASHNTDGEDDWASEGVPWEVAEL